MHSAIVWARDFAFHHCNSNDWSFADRDGQGVRRIDEIRMMMAIFAHRAPSEYSRCVHIPRFHMAALILIIRLHFNFTVIQSACSLFTFYNLCKANEATHKCIDWARGRVTTLHSLSQRFSPRLGHRFVSFACPLRNSHRDSDSFSVFLLHLSFDFIYFSSLFKLCFFLPCVLFSTGNCSKTTARQILLLLKWWWAEWF